jgi:ATP-GRASP peptide maturase of grasp-with-spasm system
VLSLLENRRRINSFFTRRLNKLAVIQLAIEQGLLTPTSYVLSNENQIIDLSDTKLITKSITDSPSIYLDGKQFVLYTNEIDFSKLESGRSFMYSLFQHKIEKKFEIRTFFLNGSFYSMAIFSQGDNKTSLDFRRYNRSFENRKVPFQLPEIIEEKLNGLFNALNLNCGSIDLIFTSNDEYLFLEINPVGQFGMVSFPCNYHLEKIIAEYL